MQARAPYAGTTVGYGLLFSLAFSPLLGTAAALAWVALAAFSWAPPAE